jgi:predicted MFS family arabinose efflux permease
VADRFPKRNLLVLTQSGLALSAATLATLDLTGARPLWAIYGVTFISGTFGSIDMPTRQAFVSEMVGLDDLTNAVGLNSAAFNLTRIGGPALGALVIEVANVGDCFALNALSYLAVIGALLAMRPDELFAGRRVAHARGQVRQGLRYIRESPRLTEALTLLLVAGTLAFNFNTVLPVLAKSDFKGNASTYAVLLVALGVGSVAGALGAARNRAPRLRVVVGAAMAMSAAMLVAAAARSLVLEVVVLVLVGFFSLLYLSTTNSTCQLASSPEMRGRVMGVYSVIFTGSTPAGALLIGLVDQELGARWGFVVGGVPTLVAATVLGLVLWRRQGLGVGWPRSRRGAAFPGPGALTVPAGRAHRHGGVQGGRER